MFTSNTKKFMCLHAMIIYSLGAIDAQNIPSCAANLVPCFAYTNVSKPPVPCCKPLNQTISTQLECLCNFYSTPGLLSSFGFNVTEALTLPARCGISGDLYACGGTAKSPGSSTTPAETDKDGAEKKTLSAKVLGFVMFFILVSLS